MGVQQRMPGEALEARLERFGMVSTIDVRVDFLSPGIGKWFVATAYVLRTGNKIAATRVGLHNDQNDLIAVGTAHMSCHNEKSDNTRTMRSNTGLTGSWSRSLKFLLDLMLSSVSSSNPR